MTACMWIERELTRSLSKKVLISQLVRSTCGGISSDIYLKHPENHARKFNGSQESEPQSLFPRAHSSAMASPSVLLDSIIAWEKKAKIIECSAGNSKSRPAKRRQKIQGGNRVGKTRTEKTYQLIKKLFTKVRMLFGILINDFSRQEILMPIFLVTAMFHWIRLQESGFWLMKVLLFQLNPKTFTTKLGTFFTLRKWQTFEQSNYEEKHKESNIEIFWSWKLLHGTEKM